MIVAGQIQSDAACPWQIACKEFNMGGYMAGSVVLDRDLGARPFDVVSLTINNLCNLQCPHCYLQYAGAGSDLIEWQFAEHLLKASFRHLAIVGKEALANRRSAELAADLIEASAIAGHSCSVVTNGLNLHFWDSRTFGRLKWLDVSIDGGPGTYQSYRGGSYAKLVRSIAHAREQGLADLRLLYTASSGNLDAMDETLAAALALQPQHVMVSPYVETRSHGAQPVAMVAPGLLLDALERCGADRDERIWLGLDFIYLSYFDEPDAVARAARMFGDHFVYVNSDPIERGFLRVTYDGLVLSPLEAGNTADYRKLGRPLMEQPLDDWFHTMRTELEREPFVRQ